MYSYSVRLSCTTVLVILSLSYSYLSYVDTVIQDYKDNTETMSYRTTLLDSVCQEYSSPLHPDHHSLHSPPSGPGVETVLLPGSPPVSVCIPHKVGSHAWGQFSRSLAKLYPDRMEKLQSMDWRSRAAVVKKAVVVRHPLERLVSAYRMIFMDWCDPNKFLRAKWKHICSSAGLAYGAPGNSLVERVKGGGEESVGRVLSAVYDEYLYGVTYLYCHHTYIHTDHIAGPDRYISRIWYKYHPGLPQDKDKMFKFSFPEFVRFLVNGTHEFADDPYVLTHQGVSYHWASYWQECPVCSSITRPDYIIHMETLSTDLATLLEDTQLSQHMSLFPHTHSQTGGHSSSLSSSFLSQLSGEQLEQLYDKYKLDHQLFGYQMDDIVRG